MSLSARRSPVPALLAILSAAAVLLGYAWLSPQPSAQGAPLETALSRVSVVDVPGLRTSDRGFQSLQPLAAPSPFAGTKPKPKPKKSKPAPSYTTSGPVVDTSIDCTKVKCVALTFDDGPGPGTPKVLKALKQAGAKATFFVVGSQAKAHPQIVKQTAEAGMEIGNHTWDHPQLSRTSPATVDKQIGRTQDAIKKASGVTPLYLRPPYGDVSKKQRKSLDMPLAFWDVDTEDWKTRCTPITVRRASAARAGDIVLMHDIHASTVDAVPGIIKNLKKRGFHLVTLSTLVGGHPQEHVGYGQGLRPGTRR